jgi:two-component system response regulator VicR
VFFSGLLDVHWFRGIRSICGGDFMGNPIPSVLLVEDDLTLHVLIRFCLEQAGYQVESAYSGEEALEILRHMTPSMTLLDNVLPGIGGFTTCQRIRELFDFPIIMVSEMDRLDEKLLGFKLGADMYLSRPLLSGAELVARIRAVLRRYNDNWELASDVNW